MGFCLQYLCLVAKWTLQKDAQQTYPKQHFCDGAPTTSLGMYCSVHQVLDTIVLYHLMKHTIC